eukprot:5158175-Pleurochrysis_carterae.AAC.3
MGALPTVGITHVLGKMGVLRRTGSTDSCACKHAQINKRTSARIRICSASNSRANKHTHMPQIFANMHEYKFRRRETVDARI